MIKLSSIYEKHIVNTEKNNAEMYIISCGYINFCSNAKTLIEQGSTDHLILFIHQGKGYFELNGEIKAVQKDSFIYYPPNAKQHYFYKPSDNAKVYFCHFGGNKINMLIKESNIKSSTVYRVISPETIVDFFEKILSEYTFKEVLYNEIAKNQIIDIFSLIARSSPENINNTKTPVHNALTDINKCSEQNRSLEEYAKMCNLSKYHFIRLFKKHTGCSPIEYRNKIRISLAQEYLTLTSMSVAEISEKLGFSSPSYFCRMYKKYTNKTAKRNL